MRRPTLPCCSGDRSSGPNSASVLCSFASLLFENLAHPHYQTSRASNLRRQYKMDVLGYTRDKNISYSNFLTIPDMKKPHEQLSQTTLR